MLAKKVDSNESTSFLYIESLEIPPGFLSFFRSQSSLPLPKPSSPLPSSPSI